MFFGVKRVAKEAGLRLEIYKLLPK